MLPNVAEESAFALKEIDSVLDRIAALIMDHHSGITAKHASVGRISNPQIFEMQGETLIKIETSTAVRGTVFPPRTILPAILWNIRSGPRLSPPFTYGDKYRAKQRHT